MFQCEIVLSVDASDIDQDSVEDENEGRVNGGHPLLLSSRDLQRLESIMSNACKYLLLESHAGGKTEMASSEYLYMYILNTELHCLQELVVN